MWCCGKSKEPVMVCSVPFILTAFRAPLLWLHVVLIVRDPWTLFMKCVELWSHSECCLWLLNRLFQSFPCFPCLSSSRQAASSSVWRPWGWCYQQKENSTKADGGVVWLLYILCHRIWMFALMKSHTQLLLILRFSLKTLASPPLGVTLPVVWSCPCQGHPSKSGKGRFAGRLWM